MLVDVLDVLAPLVSGCPWVSCKVKVALHSLCVGFGRGKFREVKAELSEGDAPFNSEKEVKFLLEDSSNLVMIENKVISLGAAVKERNESTGQASISYHTMVPKPGEDGFSVKQDRSLDCRLVFANRFL